MAKKAKIVEPPLILRHCSRCNAPIVFEQDEFAMSLCMPCWKEERGYDLTKSDKILRKLQRYCIEHLPPSSGDGDEEVVEGDSTTVLDEEEQVEILMQRLRAKLKISEQARKKAEAAEKKAGSAERKAKAELARARVETADWVRKHEDTLEEIDRTRLALDAAHTRVQSMALRIMNLTARIENLQSGAGRGAARGAPASTSAISLDRIKQLIKLVHPDRHGNSPVSNEVTQWLLELRQAQRE